MLKSGEEFTIPTSELENAGVIGEDGDCSHLIFETEKKPRDIKVPAP